MTLRCMAVMSLLCLTRPSGAGDAPRLLLLSSQGPVAVRLQAELVAAGWEVTSMPSPRAGLDLIGLHSSMSARRASAAIALLPEGPGHLDVWIIDEVGMVVSQERFDHASKVDVVALRTVERLRAHRIQVQSQRLPRRPTAGPAPRPSSQMVDLERPHARNIGDTETVEVRHSIQINTAMAIGWAPGGLSPSGQVEIGGSWLPLPWIAVDLRASVPVVPSWISAREGDAEVYPVLTGVAVRWLGGDLQARFRPTLGLGMGVLVVHLRGHAKPQPNDNCLLHPPAPPDCNPPHTSRNETLVTGLPFIEGGVLLRLTPHLNLHLSYLLGAPLQRPVVVFAGRPVGMLGRPLLTGSLGLELVI